MIHITKWHFTSGLIAGTHTLDFHMHIDAWELSDESIQLSAFKQGGIGNCFDVPSIAISFEKARRFHIQVKTKQ